MKHQKIVRKKLKTLGFELARCKTHMVFKHRDGRIFVCSKTPSCPFVMKKIDADLRKLGCAA